MEMQDVLEKLCLFGYTLKIKKDFLHCRVSVIAEDGLTKCDQLVNLDHHLNQIGEVINYCITQLVAGKPEAQTLEKVVDTWCNENNVGVHQFTAQHIRLNTGGSPNMGLNIITVDVYLKSKRYHVIKHPVLPAGPNERGDIGNIEVFLESMFNNY